MSNGISKINVGFTNMASRSGWFGGLNYFKNLFAAIKLHKESKINPIIFLNASVDNSKIASIYSDLATLVESKALFKDKSILNKLNRRTLRFAKKSFFHDWYFKQKNIEIISHSDFSDSRSSLKKINWIPDFQHLYMPELFSDEELELRTRYYKLFASNSEKLILSSNSAFNDFKKFNFGYEHKVVVMPFVSIPSSNIYDETNKPKEQIKQKYDIGDKYFYMPNQFWKHKNHIVVFEAVKILKSRGVNIQIVFTGSLNDYRNNDHIQELLTFVKDNSLENNLKILGLIDYNDVQHLTRNCISLINPSLFEGWNTMVEEAKSIGKNIILSDLDVHKEQDPPSAIYFNPYDAEDLAQILKNNWLELSGGPDYKLENTAKANLNERIINFAKQYEKIIMEVSEI